MMLLVVAAALAPANTPRGFIERLYANYRHESYSPFVHPERVFAPKLLAAIREDERLAHGEVGYLDGDPICQCQDADGMRSSIQSIARTGPSSSTARILIRFGDSTDRRDLKLSLFRTESGWRIADVNSADEPSLLAALEKANREARAKSGRK
jgi:Protein of unknown function (DUF3828)